MGLTKSRDNNCILQTKIKYLGVRGVKKSWIKKGQLTESGSENGLMQNRTKINKRDKDFNLEILSKHLSLITTVWYTI